jgi:hypothetical protein
MDDATFDAAALAIIRPSWADRDRYPDAAAQVAALRVLADRRAAERRPLIQVMPGHNGTSGLFPPPRLSPAADKWLEHFAGRPTAKTDLLDEES